VCLTQEAYGQYSGIIRPGGLLLMDSRYVQPEKKVAARQVGLPMYQTVMDTIGKPIVFNICMLGALIKITDLVQPESIMTILEKRIPAGFLDMNQKALDLGMELGAQYAA
jgi:2-oxoglutarate ferredoxin oxidoreductase subunit gamma